VFKHGTYTPDYIFNKSVINFATSTGTPLMLVVTPSECSPNTL
jgi:hypothetical protein